MSAPILTAETVKRLLTYDPESGVFTWLRRPNGTASWNTRYAGKAAGSNWAAGPNVSYRVIRIFDWPFLAHRLAFLLQVGEWPVEEVDHIDGNGLNNSWANLRPASKTQNAANRGVTRRSSTGFKGVSRVKRTGRFRATIQINGLWKSLGSYVTPEEASAAYQEAAAANGAFARAR